MKVRIEINAATTEPEVVIRTSKIDDQVKKIEQLLLAESKQPQKITVYQDDTQIYLAISAILFIETEARHLIVHTVDEMYSSRQRLYELEGQLPDNFVRVSKSAVVNTDKIFSITRSISNYLIQFQNSPKQLYASRRYYKQLRERLDKGRLAK